MTKIKLKLHTHEKDRLKRIGHQQNSITRGLREVINACQTQSAAQPSVQEDRILTSMALTRQEQKALEMAGGGNRTEGVRVLLAMFEGRLYQPSDAPYRGAPTVVPYGLGLNKHDTAAMAAIMDKLAWIHPDPTTAVRHALQCYQETNNG